MQQAGRLGTLGRVPKVQHPPCRVFRQATCKPVQRARRVLRSSADSGSAHSATQQQTQHAEEDAEEELETISTSSAPARKHKPPPIRPLPPVEQIKFFVNLTNGIEGLPVLHELGLPYSFVRIQSTMCEQQMWEDLLNDLDANLLISLALGQCCIIVDYGSRHKKSGNPRALWVGLEFVRYALTKVWFGHEAASQCGALTRGYNVTRQFDNYLRNFSKRTIRMMKYYKKWLHPDMEGIRLHGAYSLTPYDDDLDYYKRTLFAHQSPQGRAAVKSTSHFDASGASELLTAQKLQIPIPGKPEDVHGTETLLAKYNLHVHYRGLSYREYCMQMECLEMLRAKAAEGESEGEV